MADESRMAETFRISGGPKVALTPDEAIAGEGFTLIEAGLLGSVLGVPFPADYQPPLQPRPTEAFQRTFDPPGSFPEQASLQQYLPGQDAVIPSGGGGSLTLAVPSYVWTFPGTLSTDQNGNFPTIVAEANGTFLSFDGQVNIAPAGLGIVVNFFQNGIQVATVTIAAGQTYAKTAATVNYLTGDAWTMQVSQVGSTTPGTTLLARARAKA